jgi:hypothetical protein
VHVFIFQGSSMRPLAIIMLSAFPLVATLALSIMPAYAQQQGPTCQSMIKDARQAFETGTTVRDGGKGPSSQADEEPQAITADQRREVQELITEAESHAGSGNEAMCGNAMRRVQSVLYVMNQPGTTAGGDASGSAARQ